MYRYDEPPEREHFDNCQIFGDDYCNCDELEEDARNEAGELKFERERDERI